MGDLSVLPREALSFLFLSVLGKSTLILLHATWILPSLLIHLLLLQYMVFSRMVENGVMSREQRMTGLFRVLQQFHTPPMVVEKPSLYSR